MPAPNIFKNQNGVIHLTLIIAALGILAFILISNTFSFRDKIFQALFTKPPSSATEDSKIASIDDYRSGRLQVIAYGQPNSPGVQYQAVTQNSNLLSPPDFNGYIIEFNDEPASKRIKKKADNALDIDDIDNYKATVLQPKHEEAKKDVLDRIKKVSPEKTPENDNLRGGRLIQGEYIDAFNGIALNITGKEVDEVKKSPHVKKVSPNYLAKATLDQSVPLIGADSVWNLTDSLGSKVTGTGVTIAIIDTGIDYQHQDLGGCFGAGCKVVGGYDFVNWDNDPMDDHGHGTHVAAIAAGNGVLKGVAPDAKLVSYKVLAYNGYGYFSDIVSAIDAVIRTKLDSDRINDIDVINMSLGAYCWGGYDSNCGPDDPLSTATNNAVAVGINIAVAAGNSGPYLNTIASPGTALDAITVGASYKSDIIAYFSSRGPLVWNNQSVLKPDVTAPGVSICAAKSSINVFGASTCTDSNHILLNGTSMASPHVAGALALLKQMNPNWLPAQHKTVLKSTAFNIAANTLSQGGGRIDALKSVSSRTSPLLTLSPISTQGQFRDINAKFIVSNLGSWQLDYSLSNEGDVRENNWVSLTQSIIPPTSTKIFTVDTKSIIDGRNIIRLQAKDTFGNIFTEYGVLDVKKWQVSSPLNSDIEKAGSIINIVNNIEPYITNYTLTLEYGVGIQPITWNPVSVNNPGAPITWDTQGFSTGDYSLRLTLDHDNISEQKIISLYLDSTLKSGWPKRIDFDKSIEWPGSYIGSRFLEPIAADLDGDGKEEVIVQKSGLGPTIYVFKSDGSLIWTKRFNNPGDREAGNNFPPIIADINNDGKKEIILINMRIFQKDYSEVYVIDAQGQVLPGWPAKISHDWDFRMIAADLNNDRNLEIIIQGHQQSWNNGPAAPKATILKNNGTILSEWSLTSTIWGSSLSSTPAVGNFDSDNDLEIVFGKPSQNAVFDSSGKMINEGELFVYNIDGSLVAGFPVKPPGLIFSSPVVADIDGDSKDDIVIGTMYSSLIFPEPNLGGVYVYNRNAQLLPGWPVGKGYNYWSTPSVGDLDKDGKLEIVASRLGFVTEVYKSNGTMLAGWPQYTTWQDYYSSIIGDVDGDNNPDVMTTAGLYVHAWNASGQTITGFPKKTEVDAQAPAQITDLENDGKLEVLASSDFDYDWINGRYKMRGSLYSWELAKPINPLTMFWPTFHHDVQRTGKFVLPSPTPTPTPTPDTTKPKISLTYPLNNLTMRANTNNSVIALGSDNVALSKIKLFVDNKLVNSATVSAVFKFNTSVYISGSSHSIYAQALDSSGNTATSPISKITIGSTTTQAYTPLAFCINSQPILSLGWTPINGATYYVVKRLGGGAPSTGYFRLNSTKTGYIDQPPWSTTPSYAAIKPGQTYSYQIDARDNTSFLKSMTSPTSITVPSCP